MPMCQRASIMMCYCKINHFGTSLNLQSAAKTSVCNRSTYRRAGWPEEPMFWIANTGFLFVNCQILDPRIKKIKKTLLFWNIFWSPNTGFLFVKRPNFGSKTGSRSLSKNHICEAILTKTSEMSFYLKQLRDTHTDRHHLTNIKKLRLLHNRPFGQISYEVWVNRTTFTVIM